MLKVYNDLTNQKEVFTSIEPGKVKMYVCGMTVYDLCHLGHARVMVVFDTMTRYLRHTGYDVTYVRNITDIDDKIIQRANDNGEAFGDLTERFIQAMHDDSDALGVLAPDQEPRATSHLKEIIDMVKILIDKGHAYAVDNGDVYYSVSSFEGYGKLSGKSTEDLQAGARVEIDDIKRDPLDFALWKSAKPNEPAWDSPWGAGRPGWHIECSAMSTCCLGNTFDIHGGGADLTFPHHENEIAQAEAATGQPFVNYWLHNGFVRINDEKMSKSLDNFFTVREILKDYQAEEVRYFIMTSQYRSPLNYGDEHLDNARAALMRFYTALRDLPESTDTVSEEWHERFILAMDDDFNTPVALAVLFDLAREINRQKSDDLALAATLGAELKRLAGILGLLQDDPERYLQSGMQEAGSLSNEAIDALVQQRLDARSEKNWAEADRIRNVLSEHKIVLEDGAGTSIWRRE